MNIKSVKKGKVIEKGQLPTTYENIGGKKEPKMRDTILYKSPSYTILHKKDGSYCILDAHNNLITKKSTWNDAIFYVQINE